MSAQVRAVKDITSKMQVGEEYVRDVIHALRERGFDALDPKWSGAPQDRTHEEQNAATAAYIRRRNARGAEPRTNFVPDSPIRQWTEDPSKAA